MTALSWGAPEYNDDARLHGTAHPDQSDREVLHDDALAETDRAFEKSGLAYRDRPSEMERRLHRDETRARNDLRPRSGNVTVHPTRCPIEEAA